MAVGAEIVKTYAADDTKNAAGVEGVAVGGAAVIIPMQVMAEKKPVGRQSPAHRVAINANDAADLATHSGITLVPIGNSIAVAVDCLFSVAGESAEIFLAKYDGAATPLLMGISKIQIVAADGTYTDGAGGYVGEAEPFDCDGATNVAVIVKTKPATGTVTIRVVPV